MKGDVNVEVSRRKVALEFQLVYPLDMNLKVTAVGFGQQDVEIILGSEFKDTMSKKNFKLFGEVTTAGVPRKIELEFQLVDPLDANIRISAVGFGQDVEINVSTEFKESKSKTNFKIFGEVSIDDMPRKLGLAVGGQALVFGQIVADGNGGLV